MKKAEAISILATSVRPREAKDRARYDEAVKMAIEALKCSETPKSLERTSESAHSVQDENLISRKAAIEALARMMPRSYTPDGSHPADEEIYKIQELYADCIESIEILPAVQLEQRWIPCSERYPDMDERVLVYTGAHEYHVWDCMSNRADNYFWEDEEGLYRNKYEASLWMPLPEPYRGGEK